MIGTFLGKLAMGFVFKQMYSKRRRSACTGDASLLLTACLCGYPYAGRRLIAELPSPLEQQSIGGHRTRHRLRDKSTIPVQLINTLHLIVPFEVTAFVTRSYSPARCFSVRISCTEQSSMIFTPEHERIDRFAQTFVYSPFSMASLAKVNASGTGSTMKSSCTHRPPYPHVSIDERAVLTSLAHPNLRGIDDRHFLSELIHIQDFTVDAQCFDDGILPFQGVQPIGCLRHPQATLLAEA